MPLECPGGAAAVTMPYPPQLQVLQGAGRHVLLDVIPTEYAAVQHQLSQASRQDHTFSCGVQQHTSVVGT
jgi:hypothetical protein